MRPVTRGLSPEADPFDPYERAKRYLIGRLGNYCSYCERRVEANLAVEHVQPKGLAAYSHLETNWTNFLLGCVNCNSTKKNKDVVFADMLMPDRDNTFLAYEYSADGKITVRAGLAPPVAARAQALLTLTGLDRRMYAVHDENGKQIVIDRASKRIETYGCAQRAASRIAADPGNIHLIETTVELAVQMGGFSIWMLAFAHDADMLRRLIDAFPGTRDSGCFDAVTQMPVSPHPDADPLAPGGHI
jgi:uncharacterized protein (TIGR02646 family)